MTSTPRARKATATKPAARPAAKAAVPAAKPAQPAAGKLNFSLLAEGAKKVTTLPKVERSANSATSKLAELVMRSYTEKQPFALPPVAPGNDPKKTLARMQSAIRRAASQLELGVSIRHEVTDKGLVVSFLGKAKNGK